MDYKLPPELKMREKIKHTKINIHNSGYYLVTTSDIFEEDSNIVRFRKGTTLGKYEQTKDGYVFIPNNTFLNKDTITNFEFGGYQLIDCLCSDILKNLVEVFNAKTAYFIYVLSLLTCIYPNIRSTNAREKYIHSFVSQDYPNIRLSENTLNKKLFDIGSYSEQCNQYMQFNIINGSGKYFTDGTLLKNSSKCNIAAWGRKDKDLDTPVINVIYIYDADKHTPVFFKEFRGNIVDEIGIQQVIKESGIKNCLIIGDKAFFNKKLVEIYDRINAKYIIPLKRNSTIIDEKLDFKYTEYFVNEANSPIGCCKRAIDDSHFLYTFFDRDRQKKCVATYVKKIGEDKEHTLENLEKNEKHMGVIHIITQMDEPCKDIYDKYKSRWDIEQMNDYLKNTFNGESLYKHSYEGTKGLMFIKFIALEMFYRVANKAYNLSTPKSPEELIEMAKYIRISKVKDKYETANLTQKEEKLFMECGIQIVPRFLIKDRKPIKKKGRPKGAKNKIQREKTEKIPKKRGRPKGSIKRQK